MNKSSQHNSILSTHPYQSSPSFNTSSETILNINPDPNICRRGLICPPNQKIIRWFRPPIRLISLDRSTAKIGQSSCDLRSRTKGTSRYLEVPWGTWEWATAFAPAGGGKGLAALLSTPFHHRRWRLSIISTCRLYCVLFPRYVAAGLAWIDGICIICRFGKR